VAFQIKQQELEFRSQVNVAKSLFTFAAIVLFINSSIAANTGYISDEHAAPASVVDSTSPIDKAFEKKEQEPSLFPSLKDKLKNTSPVWRDSSLSVNARSYYFDRSRSPGNAKETWATGGWLAYKSGWWRDRINFGTTLYTSQKLYGPKDKDGTLLLKRGQKSFSVLGEAFVNAKLTETIIARAYRQSFNLPYINRNDNRMLPNTYEAYTIMQPVASPVQWIASHITKMKKKNSSEFENMTKAAGLESNDDGLSMVGARYTLSNETNIGAISQYTWDFMNTFYAEANWLEKQSDDLAYRFSGQYTHQKSVGNELGGDFSTYVYGAKAAASYRNATLTLAYTSVSDDSGIRSPFGGYPGYLSLMIQDFNRADEEGWLIGVSYDFKRLGFEGLSSFINYAKGDTPNSGPNASPDQTELDITVDYKVKKGTLKGLWLRARWVDLDQDDDELGAVDKNDVRLILNYELQIL